MNPKKIKVERFANNPRKITKTQLEKLEETLRELGDLSGSVFNKKSGQWVGGNQRSKIFEDPKTNDYQIEYIKKSSRPDKQGTIATGFIIWEGKKYAYREVSWNQETERKANVVANKGGGDWDFDLLEDFATDEELIDWGFEKEELTWIDETKEAKEDDYVIPNTIKTDIVRGDLFEFKKGDLCHRLLCGDSTDSDDVAKLMDGKKADMVFTDPPYNTGMTAQTQSSTSGGTLWKGSKGSGGKARLSHMFNDSYTEEQWRNFMDAFLNNYSLFTKDDCCLYICLDWRRNHELVPRIKKRFKLSNIIVWDKVVHGLGSDYKYTYELINVCKKGKPELDTHQGEREYSDVWHIQRKMGRDKDHATKKPIELCERGIRHASGFGQIVLDLFGGSGSTMIASHQLQRNCFVQENDEKYCQVICDRMLKLDEEIKLFKNGKDVTKKYRASA